jgi:hypothetical protein
MFSRSIGSAVGVAVFGAIANAALAGTHTAPAIARASHHVFIGVAVAAVLTTVAMSALPRLILEPAAAPDPVPDPLAATAAD